MDNELLLDSASQIMTNKTIDAKQNSITNIGTDELAQKYKGAIDNANNEFDWNLARVFRHTLQSDTPLMFNNIHIGVKDFVITGDFVLELPEWVKILSGEYKGLQSNFIQVVCTNSTIGVLEGWCNIYQEII